MGERQKVQLRQKALKKGLDPEALTGKHPPKIRMYSKYERRTDTRTYDDRKKLYEGGWEVIRAETLEVMWKEKYEDWTKRKRSKPNLFLQLQTSDLLDIPDWSRHHLHHGNTQTPSAKPTPKLFCCVHFTIHRNIGCAFPFSGVVF